jgi:hypothetical protein
VNQKSGPTDSMPNNFKPTSDSLQHVLYEIYMLCEGVIYFTLSDEARRQRLSAYPEWVRNALLESALIHARALAEFFKNEKDQTRGDDQKPEHYTSASLPPSQLSTDLLNRMHKEVAHLTYSRSNDPNGKAWVTSDVFRHLEPAMREFLKAVELETSLGNSAPRIREVRSLLDAAVQTLSSQLDVKISGHSPTTSSFGTPLKPIDIGTAVTGMPDLPGEMEEP